MSCRRRPAEWTEAGVWPRLHEMLLAKLRSANTLDFSRTAVDGSHIRALRCGGVTGRDLPHLVCCALKEFRRAAACSASSTLTPKSLPLAVRMTRHSPPRNITVVPSPLSRYPQPPT